jgi:phospholipid transport system substrate-binding protein
MTTRAIPAIHSALLIALLTGAASANAVEPQALVRDTADKVLAEVRMNKAELQSDTSRIYSLVQETVVPHFDFARMSQSALGRHWRDTTVGQRERLTAEFRELLVRTYAVALLEYSGQTISYLPVRVPDGAKEVMIPTRVNSGGAPVPINYRLYREGDTWKIFDVVIDGVSMVTNYRSTFANQVRRSGIDGLIEQLAKRNEQLRG